MNNQAVSAKARLDGYCVLHSHSIDWLVIAAHLHELQPNVVVQQPLVLQNVKDNFLSCARIQ